MMHPEQLFEVARLRHQDDLKQAEAQRLGQQLKENQPGLLQRVGNLLRVARQQLDTQVLPRPTQPAMRSISDQFKQVR